MAEHRHFHAQGGKQAHEPVRGVVALTVGIVLNLGFVVIEGMYGLMANSMALVADAGHNLGDVLGLVIAWIAMALARRAPSPRYTYGLRRGTIVAALANAALLLVAVGAMAIEAIRRLGGPGEIASATVMAVAAAGIVINGVTAWMLAAGRKNDINLRAAFLHMMTDALVSLGVVVTGAVIWLSGWTWLDSAASLAIAGVILAGTWGLLRDSIGMSLDAVPPGVRLSEVNDFLERQPGVASVHDLHIWPMSTTETVLTCHCLMPAGHPGDEFLAKVAHELRERFDIGHATIQIEIHEHIACALESEHIV
ncbi:MAG TPA: cation diffusion facilitator family transporter [Nitrosospira sp.]|nr:cation diffusion facilitator family transporter [Nitrosospira sp.]